MREWVSPSFPSKLEKPFSQEWASTRPRKFSLSLPSFLSLSPSLSLTPTRPHALTLTIPFVFYLSFFPKVQCLSSPLSLKIYFLTIPRLFKKTNFFVNWLLFGPEMFFNKSGKNPFYLTPVFSSPTKLKKVVLAIHFGLALAVVALGL